MFGEELFRPNIKWIISNSAPIFLNIFTSLGIFISVRKKSWRELPIELKAMFFLSTFSLLGLFFSKRFLEYGVPFSFIYAGVFLAREIDLELWKKLNAKKKLYLKTAGCAILSIYVSNGVNSSTKLYSQPAARPYKDYAVWARKIGLPIGTVIANLNWSEFPMLFNSAPEFRYLVGIEPMFGYAYDPEKMKKIELIRTGQDMLHPNKLKELLNTNFVFVSYIDAWLAKNMYLSGYAIIYQGIDGWVFDLNRYIPEQHPKMTKPQ